MGTQISMERVYRGYTAEQNPMVPRQVIDGLPMEDDGSGPYLHQSGGWVMVIGCGDRVLSQVDEDVLMVGEYACEAGGQCGRCGGCCEGEVVYVGGDFDAAWAVLTA